VAPVSCCKMDQTRPAPANLDLNNNNNNPSYSNNENNNNNNNKSSNLSHINNKISENQKEEVTATTKDLKTEDIESTWRGPEGEAGSRAWVVQGQAGVGRGRYLVARRTLPAGSVILEEGPLVVTPKTSITLTCVNCCSRIGIPYLPCVGCGFPLCPACQPPATPDASTELPPASPELPPVSPSSAPAPPTNQTLPEWHKVECHLLKTNGWQLTSSNPNAAKRFLHLLSVLRLLLRRGWEQLEGHTKERRKSSTGVKVQRTLVPVLGSLRDGDDNVLFTEEEIHHAAGVLDINAFEWRLLNEDGQVSKLGRLIFPRASLFNSSCVPSCVRSIDSNGRLVVRAGRPILAGEELTICYADTLLPTNVRQQIFKHKHFTCQCQRCEESSELPSPCNSFDMHKNRYELDNESQGMVGIRNL